MTISVDLTPPATPEEAAAQTGGLYAVAAYIARHSRQFSAARRYSIGAAGFFREAGMRDAARIAADYATQLRRVEAVTA